MLLAKQKDESDIDYHKRLVYGKLVDKTLADIDYSELSQYVYGKEYSSDVARRMFYGSRYTLDLFDKERVDSAKNDSQETSDEIDAKILELRKERQKLSDQRTGLNKLIRDISRREELNEIITTAVNNGNPPRLDAAEPIYDPSSNDILVSLNDIHYGISIDNKWNHYSPDICADMMTEYLRRIIEIAERHHSENCIVYNCGDSISGNIHKSIQIANKENVVDQVKGVSELIAQFLFRLSGHFHTVEYVSVSGNHSRLTPNEDESPYDERLDDLIEWYVEARLQNVDNVHINKSARIDPSIFVINIRDKVYCGVHGNFDASADKIASLRSFIGAERPLYCVLSGHYHHNKYDDVQGVKTLMAGSFLGVDDYCIQRRIYGRPEQAVSICDSNGIVCNYDIDLSQCTRIDPDSSFS